MGTDARWRCRRLHLATLLALLLLGAHARAQDCTKAQHYFDRAVALSWTMQNHLEKEELYRKAIELCPSHGAAHNNLADVYEREGRFTEAIAEYKESARLTGSAVPVFGVADVYFKTNRPTEALEWYERGLKLDPADRLSARRAAICRDLLTSPVIKADTIKAVLTPGGESTRGPGEVISIQFGERLIPFDFDSAPILPRGRPQLDEIGKALATMPGTVLEIAGHTDARGSDEYNLALSDRRAGSVAAYLQERFAIPSERLQPRGYGERVPVCTIDASEACHALNRRVELVRTGQAAPSQPGVVHVPTRSVGRVVSFRDPGEPLLVLETGFFAKSPDAQRVARLSENSRLRSRSDSYFVFFRPLQDCHVYVLQEDSHGKVTLLFPSGAAGSRVRRGEDYWVPGFGSAYTLDDAVGNEALYLVATSWPLDRELEGVSLTARVHDAIPALSRTRIVKAVPPSTVSQSVGAADLAKTPGHLNGLLDRIEGQGGWVNVVRFTHW